MTFAELRQAVLDAGALSTNWFAEQVTYRTRARVDSTINAKIEYETKPKVDKMRPMGNQSKDENQRIRVMVSRASVPTTPLIGDLIFRASTVDTDVRPWTYAGEIVSESSQHGTYIFERSRRQFDDRRHAQS